MSLERTMIEKGMARALFVCAWVTAKEELGTNFPPRTEYMDVAPATPLLAVFSAYRLAGAVEQANGMNLLALLHKAAKADGIHGTSTLDSPSADYAESFGHYLAMESMGHGVSWFDDHARFELTLPDIEEPQLDEFTGALRPKVHHNRGSIH